MDWMELAYGISIFLCIYYIIQKKLLSINMPDYETQLLCLYNKISYEPRSEITSTLQKSVLINFSCLS